MNLLHRYFIGSTLSLVFFVFIILMIDTTSFFLSTTSFFGLSFDILFILSIPFVYVTTLMTYLGYLLINKYFPSWNYILHCICSGLLFSCLYGVFFFEINISKWIKLPICYAIILGAGIFSSGKYFPVSPFTKLIYLVPIFMGLISFFYPVLFR